VSSFGTDPVLEGRGVSFLVRAVLVAPFPRGFLDGLGARFDLRAPLQYSKIVLLRLFLGNVQMFDRIYMAVSFWVFSPFSQGFFPSLRLAGASSL